jgi:cytochrome P450
MSEAPGSMADPATQQCPWDYYARAHAQAPVHFDTTTGLWIVTGHAELAEAARRWEIFSSAIDMRRDVSTVDPSEAEALLRREGWIAPDVLSQVDPPRHRQFRKLVEGLFTGPAVKRLQSYLDAHVAELLDAFPTSGPVDFMNAFAVPLPIDVIVDQLGLPRAHGAWVKRWTDAIIETLNALISAERRLACTREIVQFQKYFVAQREARLLALEDSAAAPRDLLGALAIARKDNGELLTTEEYIALCAQLMVAGNETTRNHLLKGAWLLAQHGDLLDTLYRDPDLAANFVAETLRLEAPVQGLFRRCTQDVMLGGVALPAGARVVLSYGAANRDPRVFPDPAEIRLDRPNASQHMAFGHGIHSCVGRVLATAELTTAFAQLAKRYSRIELDPGFPMPQHRPHFSLRGLDSLVLRLTPRL